MVQERESLRGQGCGQGGTDSFDGGWFLDTWNWNIYRSLVMPEITERIIDRLFEKLDSIESNLNAHMVLDADRSQYNRMKLDEIERQTKATNGKVAEHETRLNGHDKIVWQMRGMWALVIILSILMTFGDKFSKLFGG